MVTQWGTDPAFNGDVIPSPVTPLPKHFPNAKGMPFALVNQFGASPSSSYDFVYSMFDVAFEPPDPSNPNNPANPSRDSHNGRRDGDIEIDMGTAYFSFLRLALVRFQPNDQFGTRTDLL